MTASEFIFIVDNFDNQCIFIHFPSQQIKKLEEELNSLRQKQAIQIPSDDDESEEDDNDKEELEIGKSIGTYFLLFFIGKSGMKKKTKKSYFSFMHRFEFG